MGMTYHQFPKRTFPHLFLWMAWADEAGRPAAVVASAALLSEIRAWCKHRFPEVEVRVGILNPTDFQISFKHEYEAFEFRLRWC